MNLALYFTFLRIFIIPLFPVIYLEYAALDIPLEWVPYLLFLILLFCESTDVIDGFLARKRNQVTDLGKILDPMADTLTRISVLFTFTQGSIGVPLLLVLVLLYREFFISTLRTICALKGFALAARTSGKVKAFLLSMVSFLILILFLLFTSGAISLYLLQKLSLLLVSCAAIYSVGSAIDYAYANRRYLRKALRVQKPLV